MGQVNYYKRFRSEGRCVSCGTPSDGKVYCARHREIMRDRMRAKRAISIPLKPKRICPDCRINPLEKFKTYCEPCRARRWEEWNRSRRDVHRARVLKIYQAYGGALCACCHEGVFEFLSLDHIDGNGAKHRLVMGGSGHMTYRWLERNNFPPGFQVLCNNCNLGRFRNGGRCPGGKGHHLNERNS